MTGAATGGGVPRNNAFGVISAIVCAVTTAAFTVMTRYVMEENTSVVSGCVRVYVCVYTCYAYMRICVAVQIP